MKSAAKYLITAIATIVFSCFVCCFTVAENEKKVATIELKSIRNDQQRSVEARVFRKEKKKVIPIQYTKLNLFHDTVAQQNLIGSVVTDEDGKGSFMLEKNFNNFTSRKGSNEYHYLAALEDNPDVEAETAELTIHDAILKISLYEEDSIHKMKAAFFEVKDDKTQSPLADVEIRFYVQRAFSLLPVTEQPVATDKNGEAVADFPATIKGDSSGNLTVVVQVEENETYGNVSASKNAKWGIPVMQIDTGSRMLWSSRNNAPWSLIIISNVIIIGIWGTILYIIAQLFKINKLK